MPQRKKGSRASPAKISAARQPFVRNHADRILLIAIEMKGAFGNEGALPLCSMRSLIDALVGVPQNVANAYSLEVKFWLRPIFLAFNYGFPPTEVNDIRRLVEENCDFLVEAYHRFHGNR